MVEITKDMINKFQELIAKEQSAKTISERLDLHGESLKVIADILLGQFDKNKDYSPKNKRT